jgi:hypothetical protein
MNLSSPRARAALVFLLALLVIWFRAPDRLAHGFLWAEDAPIFMKTAHQYGYKSILMDYAGYLHIIPRLIAYLQFRETPIAWAPYVFVWTCTLLMATMCAYIAFVVRNPVAAILIGLAPVVSPQNGEVLLTITNLQWMLFPCLLVLLWECLFDTPERFIWPRAVAMVALTLTGPFGVLVWPIAILVAISRGKRMPRRAIAWMGLYTAAALAQAWMMYFYPAIKTPAGHVDWIHRAPRELFADLLPGHAPLWTGVVVAIWLCVIISTSRAAFLSAALCAIGIAIWALGAYRTNGDTPVLVWYIEGARYLYIPLLMFLWAAILSAVTARTRVSACASILFSAMILLASVTHFDAEVYSPWSITPSAAGRVVFVPPGWSTEIEFRSGDR